MTTRGHAVRAHLSLVEGPDGPSSVLPETQPCEAPNWPSLLEGEHARAESERARADAAEARVEELRRAEIDARSRAGTLKWQLDASRTKLEAAVEENKQVRRTAKDALSLEAEVARLTKLLAEAGVDTGKRGSVISLRQNVRRLRNDIDSLREENKRLAKEAVRLGRAQRKTETLTATIASLREENAGLRKAARTADAREATIATLREKNTALQEELASLLKAQTALQKELAPLRNVQAAKHIIASISEENTRLQAEVRELKRQARQAVSLGRDLEDLRWSLRAAHTHNEKLKARHRDEIDRLNKEIAREREIRGGTWQRWNDLMAPVRRRVGQLQAATARAKDLIASLRERNARLRTDARDLRAERTELASRVETLETTVAELRATRAVLSKALFGSKSEQQEKPRSERQRGQQPGTAGHGRTDRPELGERAEERNPPADACVCGQCGQPYVHNGAEESTLLEIEVCAHKRVIRRPRWRRTCKCASSPMEVSAPPAPRLFPRTPYGTSVWARFLFERYACLRPLNRVSAWLSDQGLPIAAGTLGDSVHRFVSLFDPVAQAIIAHQNEAAVRHGDETGWRIQSLSDAGRSSRAWLWTSVSQDAVYFHIDPSRSAEVAKTLFGDAGCTLFLVCDRHGAYKKMARELDGAVVLALCWVHQRRDFIECAAGHVRFTRWCQRWIERFASIYRLNEARLVHYDPALERQTPAFAEAQRTLEAEVESLFAYAEQELASLTPGSRKVKPLRSLLNHREGLSVFVHQPSVPMDNNAAERALRGPVIGRRLSFGSDSETGARFTAQMYSVIRTLSLNGIDVRRWLQAWLEACAKNGGKPPDDLSPWLPWSMSEERRRALMAPG